MATVTPTPAVTPTAYIRPIVTVLSYGASSRVLTPGQEIDMEMTVQNTGALTARNVLVAFGEGDLVPRETGGLRSVGDIAPGGSVRFWQPMRVNSAISGYEAVINIEIRYNDEYGTPYTDRSTLSFEARVPGATRTPSPTPTPTGTLSVRPLVLIEGFETDPEMLTPGTVFDLNIHVVNASGEAARQVIVMLQMGGAAAQQGGQAAASDLAPTTGSVRYVDQVAPGERVLLAFEMAVDGEAEGGLVPVTLQLSYMDNYNLQHTDTQTISLAVNAVPHLRIGLFEPLPEFIGVGDTFELPVEIINIGTQTVNISTVEVAGDSRVTIEDASLYIGPLDAGTSGSLVALVTAHQAGAIPLEVRVQYLNSFQQPEVLTETISVQVEAVPAGANGSSGNGGSENGGADAGDDGEMTVGERLWRALLGFLGLGTRDPQTTMQNVPQLQPAEGRPERSEE